ncbi:G-protein coupled receptor 183-like [Lepisosteus oculatus]|uniref:G-protein coupled receptor 183-like n=1 Tax=Lepisosteus oculatus TaxID=7918 RepID=UPI00073FC045|nr:PREDICTED: G-protein coupled receptor 183-like [Lepisosteus oculatus]
MVSLNLTVPLAVDFNDAEDYFIFITNLLIATTSFLVAGSVVLGIMCKKELRAQNRFIFMLNTSISDTLTGLGGYYIGLFDVQEGYPSKNGTYFILPSLLGVNILTIMSAQVDRFLAVVYPYTYNRYVSRTVVIGVCVSCWFYTYFFLLVQNLITIEMAARMNAYGILTMQIIIILKVLLNVKLYLIAKYQIAREPPGPQRDSKKESLRLIIVVVVCFLALWTPRFYYIIVVQVTRSRYMFKNNASDPFSMMIRFTATCTPGLYIWGSPALREAVLKTVWGRVCPPLRKR